MPQLDGKQLKAASVATAKLNINADLTFGGFKGTNLATPTAAGDAATKGYVDSVQQGLDVKDSCRLATAAALAANTYNAGTKRLTAVANGALSVDGVAVAANDRVLVKNEATDSRNGIYKVIQTGDAGNPYILERSADFDSDADVTSGAFTFIEEGTDNDNAGFVLTTNNPITLDTTALSFTQFSGAGQITARDAITKTGNTLDFNPGNGLEIVGGAGSGGAARVKTSEIAGVGMESDGATPPKLRLAAQGNGIAGGAGSTLSVQAADSSVSVAGGGVTAATPVKSTKDMTASVTVNDGDKAAATTLTKGPANGSALALFVNGLRVKITEDNSGEAYIGQGDTATARAWANIANGDTIRWNQSVAGYNLAATDKLDLEFVHTNPA